ncbi:unnamed protein product [Ixodes hexagonus]
MITVKSGTAVLLRHLKTRPATLICECHDRLNHSSQRAPIFSTQKNGISTSHTDTSDQTSQNDHSTATAHCEATESRVLELVRNFQITEALSLTIKTFKEGSKIPTCRTITALISALARKGDVTGVERASSLAKRAYPNFWAQQIAFEHYHAEALYRAGKTEDAVDKFEALFVKHPRQRDKISNLVSFFSIYLLAENRESEVELLVRMCVRLADKGYYHPLANVWKALFLSENKRYHVTAWTLVDVVKGQPNAKEFFEKKVSRVLVSAVETDDIDVIHRLLDVVLHLQIESCYGTVLSFLLEFYCDGNDVANAQRTFEHARERGVELNPVTFYRYTCFLSSHGIQIPHDVLLMKYKIDKRQSSKGSGVKFKF